MNLVKRILLGGGVPSFLLGRIRIKPKILPFLRQETGWLQLEIITI
jgi:hypothetical protein